MGYSQLPRSPSLAPRDAGRTRTFAATPVVGAAGLATAAVVQAVDGVALKAVVDLWSSAGQDSSSCSRGRWRLRQVEIGLDALLASAAGRGLPGVRYRPAHRDRRQPGAGRPSRSRCAGHRRQRHYVGSERFLGLDDARHDGERCAGTGADAPGRRLELAPGSSSTPDVPHDHAINWPAKTTADSPTRSGTPLTTSTLSPQPARSPRFTLSPPRSTAGRPPIIAALRTGLSNAASEGHNRIVKQIGRTAFGFRNTTNQRRRIRWACTRRNRLMPPNARPC